MKGLKLLTFLAGMLAILGQLNYPVIAQVQATPSPDEINRVAQGLYCPICDNIPLESCENSVCRQWREEISRLLTEGWSDQAIREYFADQYGPGVLALPPAHGLNLLIYIIPPLVIVMGFVIVFRLFRKKQDSLDQIKEHSSDPYIQRVEAELRRREKGGKE